MEEEPPSNACPQHHIVLPFFKSLVTVNDKMVPRHSLSMALYLEDLKSLQSQNGVLLQKE